MTGRDDKLPSVLVLAQDGRTAPLRTLPPTDEYALNEELSSALELLYRFLASVTQKVAEKKDDAQGTYGHFWASSK